MPFTKEQRKEYHLKRYADLEYAEKAKETAKNIDQNIKTAIKNMLKITSATTHVRVVNPILCV